MSGVGDCTNKYEIYLMQSFLDKRLIKMGQIFTLNSNISSKFSLIVTSNILTDKQILKFISKRLNTTIIDPNKPIITTHYANHIHGNNKLDKKILRNNFLENVILLG